jgi:flagellar FliJ protein
VKRFEFNLDGLLRVKRQLEHVAELEQHKAAQAVRDAVARLDALKDQLARASDTLSAQVGQAVPASRWVTAYDLLEKLGRQMTAAETDVRAAEQKLADARRERVQVATEVEALRTLRQQQWDQWRQEVAAADQERLDELGLRRWMAAQASPTARSGAA